MIILRDAGQLNESYIFQNECLQRDLYPFKNYSFSSYAFPAYGICRISHRPDECGTKPFFRWLRVQGHSLDMLGGSKNASDLISILLKRGTSGTRQ